MELTSKDRRNLWLILITALAVRLAMLPFSQQIEADGITRIWHAMEWLDAPWLIWYGRQGPLHLYLLASSLVIGKSPLWAPIVLHVFFSAATAVLVYLFTRVEFETEAGSLIAGLGFALYPVAIRNSLTAMPETPFVFFLALSMYFLARGMRSPGSYKFEVLAGLSLTLAGMIRFEGWEFIPLLGILLIRDFKKMVVFGLSAAIFPLAWLAGNQIHYGDALYSMHWSTNWELNVAGNNEDLTMYDYIERTVYFPAVVLLGLTPLTALLAVWGAVKALFKKQAVARWLVPLVGLLAAMTLFAIRGSLDTQARYTISLSLILLPYLAWLYRDWKLEERKKQIVFGLALVLMIPLGYLGNLVSPARNFYTAAINPIPQLREDSREMATGILDAIDLYQGDEDYGLISDFYSYRETYYVAMSTGLNPDDIFIAPGVVHEELSTDVLERVLTNHPEGLLILLEDSDFSQQVDLSVEGQAKIMGVVLHLTELGVVEGPAGTVRVYQFDQ
ncbi:MAG: ArnT family glycosyltransferase [Anaerolineales bacterium]